MAVGLRFRDLVSQLGERFINVPWDLFSFTGKVHFFAIVKEKQPSDRTVVEHNFN